MGESADRPFMLFRPFALIISAFPYRCAIPRINTSLTSGRVNSTGSDSPADNFCRTCVPLR
jgi:hypothetical protein